MVNFFLIQLIAFLIAGCVGTVEEGKAPSTETSPPIANNIKFDGVKQVVPISDTKLEIKFDRAEGGSGKYIYQIYIGELPPVYVPSENFNPLETTLKYTAFNLSLGTKYSVRVEVRDASITDAKVAPISNNLKYDFGTTFTNEVCDFRGISDVQNMPGDEGRTSFKIKWAQAGLSSSNLADGYPASFEVILIAKGFASTLPGQTNPIDLVEESFDNQTLSPQQGRYVFSVGHLSGVNEFIARGLMPNYNYNIRVRCLHRVSIDSKFEPNLRSELNTNTVRASTLSQSISFDDSTINYGRLAGAAGFTGIKGTWGTIAGAFNHIRIYSSPLNERPLIFDPTCLRSNNCEKFDFTSREGIITGLSPGVTYYLSFYICLNQSCSERGVYGEIIPLSTTPSVINATGNSFKLSYEPQEIGTIRLQMILPNFQQGFIDEYKVEYRKSGSPTWIDTQNIISQISLDPYDIFTATELVLRGVGIGGSDDEYEFKVTGKQLSSESITPAIFGPVILSPTLNTLLSGPKNNEFQGISNILIDVSTIQIKWTKPSAGFYSHYDFYVCDTSNNDCTSSNPVALSKLINEPSLSIYRDEISCLGNSCSKNFSINRTQRIRIGLTTSFYSPFVLDGMLPRISNTGYWECGLLGLYYTCSCKGTCSP